MEKVILGLDIGTTNVKLIAVSRQGEILFDSKIKLDVYQSIKSASEQKPELILSAVLNLLREIAVRDDLLFEGLSFSCAMHSLILLDKDYLPLTDAILWSDNRAQQQIDDLKANLSCASSIYQKTGTPIHPMSVYAKLLWMKQEKQALLAKAAYIVGIKDYLMLHLFDELVTDCSLASASGLFNIENFDWDSALLSELNLFTTQLPKIVPMDYQLAKRTPLFTSIFSNQKLFPCFIGGGDGMLSNIGVGAVDTETLAFTMGTSGAMRLITSKPVLDLNEVLFCYALDKSHWLIGGASNNGGNVLEWITKSFEPELSVPELLRRTAKRLANPPELLFYPYLHGERAPLMNAKLTAQFIQIQPQHEKADFLTAAVLGMAFNFRLLFEKIKQANFPVKSIRFTGGVSQSEILRQLFADLLNLPIEVLETEESSALGAAIIAIKALDLQKAYCLDPIYQNKTVFSPDPEHALILETAYQHFKFHLPI